MIFQVPSDKPKFHSHHGFPMRCHWVMPWQWEPMWSCSMVWIIWTWKNFSNWNRKVMRPNMKQLRKELKYKKFMKKILIKMKLIKKMLNLLLKLRKKLQRRKSLNRLKNTNHLLWYPWFPNIPMVPSIYGASCLLKSPSIPNFWTSATVPDHRDTGTVIRKNLNIVLTKPENHPLETTEVLC